MSASGSKRDIAASFFPADLKRLRGSGSPIPRACKRITDPVDDFPEVDHQVVFDFRKEDVHLCTSFCDLLIDLSSSPLQSIPEDEEFAYKMELALEECEPNHDDDPEGHLLIELRGIRAGIVPYSLVFKLYSVSRTTIKYVDFVVGCKAHGIGDGKLRNMVCSLLKTDETIKFENSTDGTIISVEIDREKDYFSVPWYMTKRQLPQPQTQPRPDAEHSQENESVSSFCGEANRMSPKRNEETPLVSSNDTIVTDLHSPFSQCDVNKVYERPSAVSSIGSNLDEEVPPSVVVQDNVETSEQDNVETSQQFFLCTIVCDFMSGILKPAEKQWEGAIQKVLAGLVNCPCGGGNQDVKDPGTCTIDLRGRFADEVELILIYELNCRPFPRYLNVIVGCKLHGLGKGILRNIVRDFLVRYQLKSLDGGFFITVQVAGWEDYTSLGCITQPVPSVYEYNDDSEDDWPLLGKKTVVVDEGSRVDELVEIFKSSMEETSLCSFVCDFLSDFPTPPGQWWDAKVTRKVLAGLQKCYESASVEDGEEDVEGTLWVDMWGQHADEATKEVLKTLYHKPGFHLWQMEICCPNR